VEGSVEEARHAVDRSVEEPRHAVESSHLLSTSMQELLCQLSGSWSQMSAEWALLLRASTEANEPWND
jgi:hypothetical protein